MMVNGNSAKNMVEELIFSPMGIFTQVNIQMANLMVLAPTPGIQEVFMKENFVKDSSTVRVYGGRTKTTYPLINMKVYTTTTKNMDTENLLGSQGIYTRAITTWMKEMALEKCCSLMELFTREIGQEGFKLAMHKWFSLMEQLEKDFFRIIFFTETIARQLVKNQHSSRAQF